MDGIDFQSAMETFAEAWVAANTTKAQMATAGAAAAPNSPAISHPEPVSQHWIIYQNVKHPCQRQRYVIIKKQKKKWVPLKRPFQGQTTSRQNSTKPALGGAIPSFSGFCPYPPTDKQQVDFFSFFLLDSMDAGDETIMLGGEQGFQIFHR